MVGLLTQDNTKSEIDASRGVRTHNSSVRAGEDSSCIISGGHCDRIIFLNVHLPNKVQNCCKSEHDVIWFEAEEKMILDWLLRYLLHQYFIICRVTVQNGYLQWHIPVAWRAHASLWGRFGLSVEWQPVFHSAQCTHSRSRNFLQHMHEFSSYRNRKYIQLPFNKIHGPGNFQFKLDPLPEKQWLFYYGNLSKILEKL